jgi:hypothetical protein
MPISQSKLQQLNDMLDSWLERREKGQLNGIDDDDDCDDPLNPLEAPPHAPFADSPPARIHGEPKRDLFG